MVDLLTFWHGFPSTTMKSISLCWPMMLMNGGLVRGWKIHLLEELVETTHGKSVTELEDEQSQTKRKYINTFNFIDEQPNKRKCKAEKFKAIQYSLGPNKEYIAIRGYEFDIWERNDDNLSIIYQDIFQKKDEGWKVTRTKTLEAKNIDEYWRRIYKSGDLEVLES
ncbi:hypothetical protein Tco_1391899 [Tanacetum coccineum]